jgi:hypothetical protein
MRDQETKNDLIGLSRVFKSNRRFKPIAICTSVNNFPINEILKLAGYNARAQNWFLAF